MKRSGSLPFSLLLILAPLALAPALRAWADSDTSDSGGLRIRLTYRGTSGPYALPDGSCPGASTSSSTDVFEGTVEGPDSPESDVLSYFGTLERKTSLDYCDLRRSATGEDEHCITHLVGHGKMNVQIDVYKDREGAYVTLEWKPGTARVDSSGSNCETGLEGEIRASYLEDGEGMEFAEHRHGRLLVGAKDTQPSRGPGDPVGPWTLEVLKAQTLRAVPGAPYRVVRGLEIMLDGSRSEGQITDYIWTLAARNCPVSTLPVTQHGAQLKLRPLCDVTAKLVVTDGTAFADDEAAVSVTPRSWETKVPDATPTSFLTGVNVVKPCGCNFGRNLCQKEFDSGAMESFHYLHHDGVSSDYENTAYKLARHQDPSGLFNDWWWVSENLLEMPRIELLNLDLVEGGILYNENERSSSSPPVAVSRKTDMDRVIACTRKHESVHTQLLVEALRRDDPAKTIEAMMQLPATDREPLRSDVNDVLGRGETRLIEADDENAVAAKLLGVQVCKHDATIRLRVALSPQASPTYADETIPCLATKSDKPGGLSGGPCPP